MAWKVLITARTIHDVGQQAQEILKQADCELVIPPKLGPLKADEIRKAIAGMDAALVSPDEYSPAVLTSPELAGVKIISRWGVGYDSIHIPTATQQGIVIAYTPGFLDETVADYTFALLLGMARRIHEGHQVMRAGEWRCTWGHDVHGKALGIVGLGRIGAAVAKRASGFSMRLLAYDPFPRPELEQKLGVKFVALDELLAESDYVSLHAALTPENKGLIGEVQLRKMKRDAYLINAGRGALIDEPALLRALTEGWIAGAALDTFTIEPMAPDHPFRKAPNVLLCPHQASFARETGQRVSNAAAQAIVDLAKGKRPQFPVNPDVFNSPQLRAQLH
jgi:phosphoglycerate dehydrogenase-like enzyme